MVVKRVGILYHPMKEAARTLAQELEKFLKNCGASTWVCSAWESERIKTEAKGTDLILTVGGDGTILRAAQAVVPDHTPIAGINLGKLGFMTELAKDEVFDKLPALLAGEGWIDERTMLEAECGGRIFYALNDVVLARGAVPRTISVLAKVNGDALTTYRADGVVVATATGSTGYSLAAGGPILHPQAEEFILIPIAPHLSPVYPLVLPPTAVVELQLTSVLEATVSIDGHINLSAASGASIRVKVSPHRTRFLRIHGEAFYASLEQKLKGKG